MRLTYARHLVRLCRRYHHAVLIAGDEAMAVALRADGLHLPERQLLRLPSLRRRYPHWRMSVAAHDIHALHQAAKGQADWALLSPLFPTQSHPGAPSLGLARLRQMIRHATLPIYPLGGITQAHLPELSRESIPGVAGISLFHP